MKAVDVAKLLIFCLLSAVQANHTCIVLPSKTRNYRYYNCNFENVTSSTHISYNYDANHFYAIVIRSSDIPRFTSETIRKEGHVFYIEITNTTLTTIEDGAFASYEELEEMRITRTKLVKLQDQVFGGLVSLKELNLSRNQVRIIEGTPFSDLSKLQTLDLSYNLLSKISSTDFVGLTRIKLLLMIGNGIFTVEEYGLPPFTSVDLSQNKFESVDVGFVSDFRPCQYLNLSHNAIQVLQRDSLHEAVIELDVSYNAVEEIAVGFFAHQFVMEKLRLSHNRISKLGIGTFVGLSSLQVLDLSYNKLSTVLMMSFQNTPRLKILDLSNNSIQILDPHRLSKFTNIQVVNFNNNDFDCHVLSELLELFKSLQVEVVLGRHRKTTAIRGIVCTEQTNTEPARLALARNRTYEESLASLSESINKLEHAFSQSGNYQQAYSKLSFDDQYNTNLIHIILALLVCLITLILVLIYVACFKLPKPAIINRQSSKDGDGGELETAI